jgi:exonuclease III
MKLLVWNIQQGGGESFRIDHALASPGLLPGIRDCRYSHDERDDGVSDHSSLLVDVED